MNRILSPVLLLLLSSTMVLLAACSKTSTNSSTNTASAGQVITKQKAGDLTATISNSKGHFSEGENEFTLEFKNASNQPVDVGAITFAFEMPAMGSMQHMSSEAKITYTGTPGVYQGQAKLDMGGTWQAHLKYKGQAGEGKADFPVMAK